MPGEWLAEGGYTEWVNVGMPEEAGMFFACTMYRIRL
jgi:hypothetical protein